MAPSGVVFTPIGLMRQRVSVVKLAPASDGMGGNAGMATTDVCDVWCSIVPVSAAEKLAAAAVNEERSHTVSMRYRDGIDATCRVNYTRGGVTRQFRITGVVNLAERNRELQLSCVEVMAEATA